MGITAFAQYHEINWTTLGENPRLGNEDAEQTWGVLQPLGWTQILASGATAWSSAQTIPFNFQFNGAAATSYSVHPSGFVTFTANPAAVSTMPTSLPSSNIPDKTVSIAGLTLAGPNDAVISKTFGVAPYRQHWVMWSSASSASSTVNWTYWSIVFEESTNHIYIVDQRTFGGNVSLLAGVQISSSSATTATGYPSLNSVTQATSGNGDDPTDNKIFAFVHDASSTPSNDVAGQSINIAPYVQVNTATNVAGQFVNYGTTTVNSLEIKYSIDGGATATATATGLNAATGQRVMFSIPGAWTPTTVGTKSIKMWFGNINGSGDVKPINDTVYGSSIVLSNFIPRVTLAEEFTSSTCGPCASFNPGYNTTLNANNVNTPFGSVNAVKYQMNWPAPGTDQNYNPDGLARRTFYGITGVPTPLLDGISGLNTQSDINARNGIPASLEIDGEWNVTGTTMSVEVDLTAASNINNPNLRLFIAATERTLTVSDYPGYAVTNGEGAFYQVMRKMLPDGNGQSVGALTNGVASTKTGSYTFTIGNVAAGNYNLWANFFNVDVIAWVQDIATGEVLQSAFITPNMIGIDEVASKYSVRVFPNPATDAAYLNINILNQGTVNMNIVNTLGQVVATNVYNVEVGENTLPMDVSNLAAGMYVVRLEIDGQVTSTKINIQ